MGILFTGTGFLAFGHYVNIVLPVIFLWIAAWTVRFLPQPRIFLLTVWGFQLLLSIGLLTFVHSHCGAPAGDFGISYACQAAP